ncbi:hypothetical protein BFINE_42430 [Bacteroides finegoldii DSM 17565]|nr:hypothetical protein BFINE_42430 [Bacteroides finegoldii DSM 17565]
MTGCPLRKVTHCPSLPTNHYLFNFRSRIILRNADAITVAYPSGTGYSVASVEIEDTPRFAYRGFMLDVSRHFFSKEFVKKQIDALAFYKINRLHLHLTDAAGWRIEIRKYPLLTDFAAWRTEPNWKKWWNGGREYVRFNEPELPAVIILRKTFVRYLNTPVSII